MIIYIRKVFLIGLYIACVTTVSCSQGGEYEMQPSIEQDSRLPSYLLNMKTEHTGIVPHILFRRNEDIVKKKNNIQIPKKKNVTYLCDFYENSDKLESLYFYSKIFNTDSNIVHPLIRYIKIMNHENIENIPIMPGQLFDTSSAKNTTTITQIIPVASCIKIINLKNMFPPQIYQELIFIFSYKYQKTETEIDHKWGIVNLKSLNQSSNDSIFTSWFISHIFVNVDGQKNQIQDSIVFFNESPSQDQIVDFITSTDFGNNDVFNYTDYSSVINVDVPHIFVYPPYENFVGTFENGIPECVLFPRIKVYNEVLVGLTSTQVTPH